MVVVVVVSLLLLGCVCALLLRATLLLWLGVFVTFRIVASSHPRDDLRFVAGGCCRFVVTSFVFSELVWHFAGRGIGIGVLYDGFLAQDRNETANEHGVLFGIYA